MLVSVKKDNQGCKMTLLNLKLTSERLKVVTSSSAVVVMISSGVAFALELPLNDCGQVVVEGFKEYTSCNLPFVKVKTTLNSSSYPAVVNSCL